MIIFRIGTKLHDNELSEDQLRASIFTDYYTEYVYDIQDEGHLAALVLKYPDIQIIEHD